MDSPLHVLSSCPSVEQEIQSQAEIQHAEAKLRIGFHIDHSKGQFLKNGARGILLPISPYVWAKRGPKLGNIFHGSVNIGKKAK
jgi:hypothetical protein